MATITIDTCPIDGNQLGRKEVREIFQDVKWVNVDSETHEIEDWDESWDNDGDTLSDSWYCLDGGHTIDQMLEHIANNPSSSA